MHVFSGSEAALLSPHSGSRTPWPQHPTLPPGAAPWGCLLPAARPSEEGQMDSSGEGRSDSTSASLQCGLSLRSLAAPCPGGRRGAGGSLAPAPVPRPGLPSGLCVPGKLAGPSLLPRHQGAAGSCGQAHPRANRVISRGACLKGPGLGGGGRYSHVQRPRHRKDHRLEGCVKPLVLN